MSRRFTAVAVLLCLAATALGSRPAPAGAATPAAPVLDQTTVAAAEDYASALHANPWDFDDQKDVITDSGPVLNATRVGLRDGMLRLTFPRTGHVSLVWPGYPGALFIGREGAASPVEASRFDRFTVRLHRDTPGAVALLWDTCMPPETEPIRCHGSVSQHGEAGWRTYTFDLPLQADPRREGWRGSILALRLVIGASTTTKVLVDWARLHAAPQEVTATWSAPGASLLIWDRDDRAENNRAEGPGWGVLGRASGRGSVRVPAGAWPPGRYHVYAVSASDPTRRLGATTPLTVADAPRIQLLDPDAAGGDDYATVELGDPWDFSQPNDVSLLRNGANVVWAGGQVAATNAPQPHQNDPYVIMRQGKPIDPRRYHRLTVRTSFDGPFSLADAEGGGMHGRLTWRTTATQDGSLGGPETWLQSREIVTYRNEDTYTFDLVTPRPAFLMETDLAPRVGWLAGGLVTTLRWDVNEDRGPRRWRMDEIRLAADDEARGGVFTIRWRDTNPATADTARVSLYADTDPSGFTGRLIAADLPQQGGEGSFTWRTAGWPAGTYHVYAVASSGTSGSGGAIAGAPATATAGSPPPGVSRSYATGPVVVPAVDRIAGVGRAATAVGLSSSTFPHAEAAVLAADHTPVDALAAGPLAAALDGPLLLSGRDQVAAVTVAELRRLGVRRVFVAGGEAVVSAAAVTRLARELPGVRIERLAGADRYRTAAALGLRTMQVYGEAAPSRGADIPPTVLLADHRAVAQALSAVPLAARWRAPLLLTDGGRLPEATRRALAELRPERVVTIGGSHDQQLLSEAGGSAGSPQTEHLGGGDAFHTATQVAAAAVAAGASARHALIAGVDRWPDTLAAGAAAAARNVPLLLTGGGSVPASTQAWVREHRPVLLVAGGRAAVADAHVPAR